ARMRAAGRRDPLAHHEARPPFVEEEAVHRALYLAAHAGVRIQIVHVSSPVSADLVRREKAGGRPATMEICPHHLLLDLDDLVREWQVDARSQQFSKNPWSPFDGRRARAGVVRTLVRGVTVYAGGEIVAEPGSGRFLSCHGDYTLGRPAPAVAG